MKRHRYEYDCKALRAILRAILCCEDEDETQIAWTLAYTGATFTFKGDFMAACPIDKVISASVAFTDIKGNPAQVEGAPVWASDNEAIFTVVASADGMSAVCTPVGPLGTAQITVKADADLGTGVTEITGIGSLEAIAGGASVVVVNFAEPTSP